MGIKWLIIVFQRYTTKRVGNRRRLLIVDNYSSHINMKFIDLCDFLNIILLILFSYFTHRLQSLDIGLFRPLITFYIQNLNALLFNSLNIKSMSKRAFWSLFQPIWKDIFTLKNVVSAFRITGIFLFNLAKIFNKITKKQPIEAFESIKTPIIYRFIRRVYRVYKLKFIMIFLSKILRSHELLAVRRFINKYII